MKIFLKQIFTWWHRQTIGTLIQTLLTGKFIESDEYGNKYYTNSKSKRWVIYKDDIESTKIPPEWHLWIHSKTNSVPSGKTIKYAWQKKHKENLTGTNEAYKPEGSLMSDLKKDNKKYETWNN